MTKKTKPDQKQKTPVDAPEPATRSEKFSIVGIGASAGGLAAFEAFFSGMPADTKPGMAFVLVQHLAPDHTSLLTELIRRYTRMTVFEVTDGMVVQPDCVYIIPPNRDMALINGTLQLLEPATPRGQRLPIDFFFRSLAQDQHKRAIGIVLSGTASDGTAGIRAIKNEGGLVIAQKPESTEYDGMPCSAIATGLVDFELLPAEMPAKIIAYVAHTSGRAHRSITESTPLPETAIKKIFILLRNQTGHDFSNYKPSTINRRIQRRMAVHQIEKIDGYVKHLQRDPKEVQALFRDVLIGVTYFFRDPEAFQALQEKVVPMLLDTKNEDAVIRVWSSGCSTGEEPYSLAILLMEGMEARKKNFTIQIFATDIDPHAIAMARDGMYPASIATDVSPERLARFFTLEPGGTTYRIHKSIRDMVVFAEQDVIKDPPFSKLDLLSCRNVMIYMGNDLQKKLISLFHYALNPGGTLFLGTSETTGDFEGLFTTMDNKQKLYRRKEDCIGTRRVSIDHFVPLMPAEKAAFTTRVIERPAFPEKPSLRELTEHALLQQVIAAGALVNGQGDIFYLHGRTGMFLEPTPGVAGINNILRMAREGLQNKLTMALHKSAEIRETVCHPGLNVKTNGHFTRVNLTVRPVKIGTGSWPESSLYLIILEEAHPQLEVIEQIAENSTQNPDARIEALQKELHAKSEYLISTQEEMQRLIEDANSSNEELQSMNEEMQSTNEELETSKEELQSINEELSTVNAELQTKIQDLTRANNDMNNLLSGTSVATIFVDHQLRILRFTPTATDIINLIPTDVGRPVGHIVSNLLDYDSLVTDVKTVLNTLIPHEVEVQTTAGTWYTLRILPYRTLTNVIEGAVITFVEITEIVHTRESLAKANELLRLAVVVRDSHDAITVQDLTGRTIAWNPGAVRMYGWSETEALTMNVHDRIPESLRKNELDQLIRLGQMKILEPYDTQRMTKDGRIVEVSIISTALLDTSGKLYAIATTEREAR